MLKNDIFVKAEIQFHPYNISIALACDRILLEETMNTDRYPEAKKLYGAIGVDTDEVIRTLAAIPISIHCWQADDVGGFLNTKGQSSPEEVSRLPETIPVRQGILKSLRF